VASGGTAVLYKAVQTSLDRIVAIKRLHQHLTSDENFTRRFILEAKAAASLDHENIVSVIDFGQENDAYQMVMEYVEGESLKEVLDRWHPIQHDLALAIAHQVCLGLEHAHQKGIVHRDIKPGNLMLTGGGRVKIADFGLAKLTQSNTSQTAANSILGTPLYMSPEQAFGESVDQRSDLFSLGTVLYELLTGRQPFASENYMGVIQNIINKNIPKVRELHPDIPENIEAIVDKALSKNRDGRFQSASEFREAIESVLGIVKLNELTTTLRSLLEPSTSTTVIGGINTHPKPNRRRSSGFGLFGIFLFALVAAGTTTALLNPDILERIRTLVGDVGGADPAIVQSADVTAIPDPFDMTSVIPKPLGDTITDTVYVTQTKLDTVVVELEAAKSVALDKKNEVVATPAVTAVPEKEPEPQVVIRQGFLQGDCKPSAEVYVDGVYRGDTPVKLRLTSGPHEIECRHPSYESYHEQLNVATNELSRRTLTLTKLMGSISLSTVAGADLYVDGEMVARTPLLNALQLDAGPHMLVIKKEGHLTWSSEVNVEAKKTLSLSITLSREY